MVLYLQDNDNEPLVFVNNNVQIVEFLCAHLNLCKLVCKTFMSHPIKY